MCIRAWNNNHEPVPQCTQYQFLFNDIACFLIGYPVQDRAFNRLGKPLSMSGQIKVKIKTSPLKRTRVERVPFVPRKYRCQKIKLKLGMFLSQKIIFSFDAFDVSVMVAFPMTFCKSIKQM